MSEPRNIEKTSEFEQFRRNCCIAFVIVIFVLMSMGVLLGAIGTIELLNIRADREMGVSWYINRICKRIDADAEKEGEMKRCLVAHPINRLEEMWCHYKGYNISTVEGRRNCPVKEFNTDILSLVKGYLDGWPYRTNNFEYMSQKE